MYVVCILQILKIELLDDIRLNWNLGKNKDFKYILNIV